MNLFVSGRLCLFGEHSDWAGQYRNENPEILPGAAIVSGIDQGIYAHAERSDTFRFRTKLNDGSATDWVEYSLSAERLRAEAEKGGFFSYVAGTAAYMLERYPVGGLTVDCYRITLPIKKGLSSSAAVCVLIARAFNLVYGLNMTVQEEMEAAYQGETLTPSQCGRLDQACAYGTKPVLLRFDGTKVAAECLKLGRDLYWVFCDLAGQKDTKRILSSLNACYPDRADTISENVRRGLGAENLRIVEGTLKALERGDAAELGRLMDEAQDVFDRLVAPACPAELTAPKLHRMMADPRVRALALGVKGVGSQGDGTVQMVCADRQGQQQLVRYLRDGLGLQAHAFTLKAQRAVRKAVIPLAGFGTRMFPATKVVDKAFLPVIDYDGNIKPALLVILEELIDAGIEEIGLIIRREEQEEYDRLFQKDTPVECLSRLPREKQDYDAWVQKLGMRITYLYQEEQLGFGHAVYQAKEFVGEEPALLVLGDHIYHSESGESCVSQMIRAYEESGKLTVSLDEVELERVKSYGVLAGEFVDDGYRRMRVEAMVEKPTPEYAREKLGVRGPDGGQRYYCVFGQYVLTPEVFRLLERKVREYQAGSGEIELTPVLDEVRRSDGMMAYRVDGKRFDIGLPEEYRKTVAAFGR